MYLVGLMKRSTFDPETIFGRSSRLQQTEISSWSIQIQSDELNWVKRLSNHELNSLNLVRLVWSTTFGPGLRNMNYCFARSTHCPAFFLVSFPRILFLETIRLRIRLASHVRERTCAERVIMKSSIAKHYGCKCAGHCGLIANGCSQANRDFSRVRNINCCFARCAAINNKFQRKLSTRLRFRDAPRPTMGATSFGREGLGNREPRFRQVQGFNVYSVHLFHNNLKNKYDSKDKWRPHCCSASPDSSIRRSRNRRAPGVRTRSSYSAAKTCTRPRMHLAPRQPWSPCPTVWLTTRPGFRAAIG